MSAALFDTHAYIKKMKAVGFTEEQTEVQAETVADLINERLVTKADWICVSPNSKPGW